MVETIHLFAELAVGLRDVLAGLTPEEWRKPTVHRDRDVKDLASHLLDTAQRRLASQRDGWAGDDKPDAFDFDGLAAFIQRANRSWIDVSRRLSPRQLIDQLSRTDAELIDLLRSEPHGRAQYSVAWAGEDVSENWFDVAREYTERWHHQQQIRDAVAKRPSRPVAPQATLALSGSDAWRLWTKGLAAADARSRATCTGPEALVAPMFAYVAIMA